MLKVYLHVLICLSLGMLTYIMFLGNEYMRGKNPIRSIILITNSRFDSTNHRMDTKNTDQSGNWGRWIAFINVNLIKNGFLKFDKI